ncbi:hypothetical protein [Rhizobium sp. MHM7A]|uniref:hypothetical protein n=1 Tax=Rhizobium sp. MHM7A TaxID=2583233 RepID=UPI00148641CE|nr:hypothetical protein [Rhizobium sp. MHM7A]
MPKFGYSIFSGDGRKRSGTIEATDIVDARRKLRSPGVTISDVQPYGDRRLQSYLRLPKLEPSFDQARFFGNLAVLVAAGLTLDQSLLRLMICRVTFCR